MLCYRCGTYSPDGSRQCSECGEAFSPERRRSSPAGLPSGRSKSSETPPFAVGQLVAGHYRLREVIARGASGWVMRARDESSENDVAIKILDPNLLQSAAQRTDFIKAANKVIKVHHANVARVFEVGLEGDFVFYTMTYLEGLTLRKIIDLRAEKKQVFSFSEAIPLVNQLAEGIQGLSRLKFHGALSPNNVLVLPDILKITGVAHFHGLPHAHFIKRLSNRPGGAYLSPEARIPDGRVSARSDVYSMAVIFAEMTTGIVYGQNREAFNQAVARLEPKMRGVLERALCEQPNARYSSGVKFVDALLDAVGEEDFPVIELEPDEGGDEDSVELSLDDVRGGEGEFLDDEYSQAQVSQSSSVSIEAMGGGSGGWDDEQLTTDFHEELNTQAINLTGLERGRRDELTEGEQSEIGAGFGSSIADERRIPSFSGVGALTTGSEQASAEKARKNTALRNRSSRLLIAALVLSVLGASVVMLFRSPSPEKSVPAEAVVIGPTASSADDSNKVTQVPPTRLPSPKKLKKKDKPSKLSKPSANVTADSESVSEPKSPTKALAPATVSRLDLRHEVKVSNEAKAATHRPSGYSAPVVAGILPEPSVSENKPAAEVESANVDLTPRVELPSMPPPPDLPQRSTCPRGMIKLEAGSFVLGSSVSDPLRGFGDLKAQRVNAESFCVDIYEYPNSRGRTPTVNVTWNRAKSLCEKQGKRLCSEREWERACKGPTGARFATGAEPAPGVCNISSEDGETGRPEAIGKYPDCRSGFGVADLAGNVAEWTASHWSSDIPDRVVKGGAADQASYTARCSARSNESSGARQANLGFRCCKDL